MWTAQPFATGYNGEPVFNAIAGLSADDLNTSSGRVAQLLYCADMLSFIEAGWADPKFHRPIEAIARRVLRST